MKRVGKYIYFTAIITSFIIVLSQMFGVMYGVKAIVEEKSKDNQSQESTYYNKMPITLQDLIDGLGIATNYAVFADAFIQCGHMEGNIAVKEARITSGFNNTTAVEELGNVTTHYAITKINKVDGKPSDGTFTFALFKKIYNEVSGEFDYERVSDETKTITTENGKGHVTFNYSNIDSSNKYYILELDESGNPILNNTVVSDGVTVTYEDSETTVIANKMSYGNDSYIQSIRQWKSGAAQENESNIKPKLILPLSQYLELVEQNKNLNFMSKDGSIETVLYENSDKMDLVIIAETDFLSYDELKIENGYTNRYKYYDDGSIQFVMSEDKDGNIIYRAYSKPTYSEEEQDKINSAKTSNVSWSYKIENGEPKYEVVNTIVVEKQNVHEDLDFTGYVDYNTIEDPTKYLWLKDLTPYIEDDIEEETKIYIKFQNSGTEPSEIAYVTEKKKDDKKVAVVRRVGFAEGWNTSKEDKISDETTEIEIGDTESSVTEEKITINAEVNIEKQFSLELGENYLVKGTNGEYTLESMKKEYEIIDFAEEFKSLRDFSTTLANDYLSSDYITILDITPNDDDNDGVHGLPDDLEDMSSYLEDGRFLVINVNMQDVKKLSIRNNFKWVKDGEDFSYGYNEESTRVLWNFYNISTENLAASDVKNAKLTNQNGHVDITNDSETSEYQSRMTEIALTNDRLIGTVLAPDAYVHNDSTVNASIFAKMVANPGGEIHKTRLGYSKETKSSICNNNKVTPESGELTVQIFKVDDTDSKILLQNAEFDITIKDGDTVIAKACKTTNQFGEIILDGIEISDKDKIYTVIIEEKNAPKGYISNGKIEFEVKSIIKDNKYVLQPISEHEEDGAVIIVENESMKITVPNTKITGNFEIAIEKVDANDNSLLPNVEFELVIKDENNTEVYNDKVRTNNNGQISIKDIKITDSDKTYKVILKETKPLDGYNPIETIEFEAKSKVENNKYVLVAESSHDEEGSNVTIESGIIKIKVPNKKIENSFYIELIKRDENDSNKKLEGAEFEIKITKGTNEIYSGKVTTDNKGYAVIPSITIEDKDEEYKITIKETKAPNGYVGSSETIEFTVTSEMLENRLVLKTMERKQIKDAAVTVEKNVISAELVNSKMEGLFYMELEKQDSKDENKKLEGAEFEVKILNNSNELFSGNVITDKNGKVAIPKIKIEGKDEQYKIVIKETKAPEGYVLDETPVEFTVTSQMLENEYALKPMESKRINDASITVKENIIIVKILNGQVKGDEIKGNYNLVIKKINSETKEGLNGVKLHIKGMDNNQNAIIDKTAVTENVNEKDGFVVIEDIEIEEEGKHEFEISEIETLEGFVKFENPITFEAEVGESQTQDSYVIKSVKNTGNYNGKVKIEKDSKTNSIAITLPNDPKKLGDLSLKKFVTSINESTLETSREPVVKYNNITGEIEYSKSSEQIVVKPGDYILYTIRVYNEGKGDATATTIKDYLPDGLEYVPNNVINNKYNWKMFDKNGRITENSNSCVFLSSDHLKGSVIPALEEDGIPQYLDLKVVLKVTDKAVNNRDLVNIAFIAEDDTDDYDSTPDNTNVYDFKGEEDDEDSDVVKVKVVDKLPQTGEDINVLKCGLSVIVGMCLISIAAYLIYKKY